MPATSLPRRVMRARPAPGRAPKLNGLKVKGYAYHADASWGRPALTLEDQDDTALPRWRGQMRSAISR